MNYILQLIIFIFINISSFSIYGLESPWGESDASKVRIISPITHINNQNQIVVGLEYKMNPGWKTYWQSPGDAGFPQEISWKGSRNIESIITEWPTPKEFEILGLKSLGYENEVIFPLKINLIDPQEQTLIDLSINYLVCKEICVPGNAKLNLIILPGKAKTTEHFYKIEKTLSLLPKKDINLTTFSNFNVDVSSDTKKTLIYVEASTNLFFDNPELYLHTPFGLPVIKPILEYSYDLKKFKAYYYFNKDLIGLNSFDLSVLLVDKNQSFLAQSIEFNEIINKIPTSKNNFLFIILVAFLGGVILNIMPCVFPVLSIKLLTVLNSQNKSIRISFLITALGIITSFILLALIFFTLQKLNIAISWGMQFQQPYFLIFISFVLSIFMINMFGIFEFQAPQIATISKKNLINKNKFFIDFLNGFFATLMATPCSAPFVGTAITAAFTQSALLMFNIFFAMGIGMSTPYLIVSLFPFLVSFFPKPGKWMLYVKYLLGLLLLLTLIWLSNILLNYYNFYFISAALSFLFISIFFLKKYSKKILIISILLISYFILSQFNFFEQKEIQKINKDWRNFFDSDIEKLIENNNIVFLDITADWCANCQFNKINVLNNSNITEIFKKNKVVKVRADWTKPNNKIDEFLHQHNRFGIPFNAFFSKNYPNGIILSELLSKKDILESLNKIKEK